MRLTIYFVFLFLFTTKNLLSQRKIPLYQQNKVFYDKTNFYTYGTKWVNGLNKNLSTDGYEHNFNFYVSRYDSSGKKNWELLVDKKRNFVTSSEIVKQGGSFYTFIATRNVSPSLGISYLNHFLIKFDSLGNVIHEHKLTDSTIYLYSSVFYGRDFIWITLNKDNEGVVCQKYDYNFRLKETIKTQLLTGFFYSSNIIQTDKKNYVSIGSVNNIDEVNKQIKNKTAEIFRESVGYRIKKTNATLTEASKITTNLLPKNEVILQTLYDNSNIYILSLVSSLKGLEDKYKLYLYREETTKLQLLTDTISQYLVYFKVFSASEFLFVTQRNASFDSKTNTRIEKPECIYYIKNGKIITQSRLHEINDKHCENKFRIMDKKLLIYQVNNFGEDIKIKIFSYENGIFLN